MQNITGKTIQKIRKQRGLTQEDLAARLQLLGFNHTRNVIAKIESGIRQVTDIELVGFANALQVSIVDFFQTSNPNEDH